MTVQERDLNRAAFADVRPALARVDGLVVPAGPDGRVPVRGPGGELEARFESDDSTVTLNNGQREIVETLTLLNGWPYRAGRRLPVSLAQHVVEAARRLL